MALQVFQDDSLAKSGGELDWIKLSDLDDQLADSIFLLPLHTISHPLQSKWGYHLVEVIDKKENPLITETDYLKALPALQKKVKMQKSRKLSLQYIYNYIGQSNPQLDPKMFMRLWNTIIPKDEKEKAVLSRSSELGQSEIKKLHVELHHELAQPFIVYREGFISLGDFLNGIEKVPLSHRFAFKSRRELANHIGRWVRDELLLADAYRENLAAHKRVINETNRFIEEQSYYFYQSQISDTMEIPSYVSAYFRQPQTFAQNTAFLRKYHTIQEWKFEYSKRQLHKILKDVKGELHINDDVLHQENKRVNWDNKIRMFMVRKPS